MIRARLRSAIAWNLRDYAKWINSLADSIEPIKLNLTANCALVSSVRAKPDYRASKALADEIIEKARS